LNPTLLWKNIQNGNKEAFNQLFKLYYSNLKAYGIKIAADESTAQEAIQLLFVKIWDKRTSLNKVTNVKSYLISAYRRQLLDLIEKEQKSKNISDNRANFNIAPDELLIFKQEQNQKAQQLAKLLNQLPEKQREIIYLRFYNQLSYLEIAEIIDLNYQSVRNYGVKAIRFLRKNWKK